MRSFTIEIVFAALIIILQCCTSNYIFAANQIDLTHESAKHVQALLSNNIRLKETQRSVDFNKTLHIRIKQTYLNYPIWGSESVLHLPADSTRTLSLASKSLQEVLQSSASTLSLDGQWFVGIEKDLPPTLATVFSSAQKERAKRFAKNYYQTHTTGLRQLTNVKMQEIIYIDHQSQAHWSYLISFLAATSDVGELPEKPTYIIDANKSIVYEQWNAIKSFTAENIRAGGYGGNIKMGKLSYDDLANHLPAFVMKRDAESSRCYFLNDAIAVRHFDSHKIIDFNCAEVSQEHNQLYWDGELEAIHGGYSPANDAFFAGIVIKNMYQDWYLAPVLTQANGQPALLTMIVHAKIDNAFWDGEKMTFGDGVNLFYPLTSLGIAAHEISHGFTEQHSNLNYYGESGGMNESFSDMAAQAAEFFVYRKNDWQIGPEIFRAHNQALRYMDQPSKDCQQKIPGQNCSINHISQYTPKLDVHYSSGVFNRVFYLIATSDGWDTHKAFDIMEKANDHYWVANSTFAQGACGVLRATRDYGYDIMTVLNVFSSVGININRC